MDNAFSHGLTSATAALSRYLLKDHQSRVESRSSNLSLGATIETDDQSHPSTGKAVV